MGIFLQARLLELSSCTVDGNRANRRVSQGGGCLPDSLDNQHVQSATTRSTQPRATGQGCMAANPSSWLLAELLLSFWKLREREAGGRCFVSVGSLACLDGESRQLRPKGSAATFLFPRPLGIHIRRTSHTIANISLVKRNYQPPQ